MDKRESLSWALGTVATLIAIGSGFLAYHSMFAGRDDVTAVRAEANANATALFLTLKNTQRGRLASYDSVPNGALTEREKKNKAIIEYDLRNIETIEQALGLESGGE